ncbi:MAG TPA: alpha-amylase family glycosyl hydrolase [Chitinophagaceae bacterium]|nr:alpha-amylase family glycosyl hydrolase [Chitinophagaceae bacterium]
MKRFFGLIIVVLFVINSSFAQTIDMYPANWWTGMKWNKVQLMLHGNNIGNAYGFSINYEGVQLIKINKVENSNYVFLDININQSARPGIVRINFKEKNQAKSINFSLKARRPGNGTSFAQGVTSADIMYLIMPDRFSNGDPSNDRVPGMLDQSLRRDTVFNRHGGDLQGIYNHLDYLQELGVSALWLNPVIENDRPERTEHGYAFTNHYKIDARLGGADAYHALIDETHRRGMKIIQDAVYNHIDINHFFVKDQPTKDWLHQWPSYTNTHYKDQTLFDPYASTIDRKIMSNGWFVKEMPDLNQNNPFVANFLIQHAIWSVEEFGIDGWRVDTYAYNDLNFMNRCNKALYNEYPKISIFGETWVHGVINQSYFCENILITSYKSNLQATTDFQMLFYGIQAALTERFGWTEGLSRLYTTTSQDIMYKNPMRQVIFLDNHDISRFYSVVGEDTAKYKMAIAWLMTFRGIPQMYYGNEILMTGFTSPNDGYVRQDFPGGWAGDVMNKFTESGRTAKENVIFNYYKTLIAFRKNASAIKSGKLMQYFPEDGVYVYFRYDNAQTIMVVMNQNDGEKTIDLSRFSERLTGYSKAYDVETGATFNLEKKLIVRGKHALVLNLKK